MTAQKTKKPRESGFELVRIIAMAMIVANHLVNHGIMKVTGPEPYALWAEMNTFNRAACAVISCGGRIGVAVFFMITGYFMAEREKISPRSVFSFLARVHFVGALMLVVFTALHFSIGLSPDINLADAAKRSLCIPAVLWWFALAYLVLLFLAPSINILLKSLKGKAYILLLILYIWFFFYKTGSGNYIPDTYVKAVLFYMMGVLVRLSEKRRDNPVSSINQDTSINLNSSINPTSSIKSSIKKETAKKDLIASDKTFNEEKNKRSISNRGLNSSAAGLALHIAIFVILFLVSGILMFDAIQDSTKGASLIGNILFWNSSAFLNNILILIDGLALLMIGKFKFTSKLVNKISACTFSVYLLHEYPYTRTFLWHNLLKADTIQYASKFFILYVMLDVLIIFLAGIIVETIRVRLGSLLKK